MFSNFLSFFFIFIFLIEQQGTLTEERESGIWILYHHGCTIFLYTHKWATLVVPGILISIPPTPPFDFYVYKEHDLINVIMLDLLGWMYDTL